MVRDAFFAFALGVGGFVAFQAASGHIDFGSLLPNFDASVFPYSRDQVETMLVDARTTLPRRDGEGTIRIWATGRSARGVALAMQYASWAPVLKCEAVVTQAGADRSRVVADCGSKADKTSAIARTQEQLQVPMFEEHIQATLSKRDFERANATRKEMAAVFSNLGGMQREALEMADRAQRARYEDEHRAPR